MKRSCLRKLFITIFFLSVCLFCQRGFAESVVSDSITGYTLWKVEHSPYVVKDIVTIPQDTHLAIEAGVEIRFDAGAYLEVWGVLEATGDAQNRITFTSSNANPSPGDWFGIVITANATVKLDYTDFNYAQRALWSQNCPNITVDNATFENNEWAMEFKKDVVALITNSTITNNTEYGVNLWGYFVREFPILTLNNSEIHSNGPGNEARDLYLSLNNESRGNVIDARFNYWGTTDITEIADDSIHDVLDESGPGAIGATAIFLPVLDAAGGDPLGAAPNMTPASPSQITSSSPTFSWDAISGATLYWVEGAAKKEHLGTPAAQGKRLFTQGPTSPNTSFQVSSLDLSSTPAVHFRLWYELNGIWSFYDYDYTNTTTFPSLGFPGNGHLVQNNSVDFEAIPSNNSLDNWVTAGKTFGGDEYLLQQFTGTLPAVHTIADYSLNGEPIYVAIWTKIGDSWYLDRHVYQRDDVMSELVTPVFGTELSASETFTWTKGTDVHSIWLCVGSSAVAPCNYYSSEHYGTSAQVNNIPQGGGTVYVTIWDKVNGAWSVEGVEYTYRTQ